MLTIAVSSRSLFELEEANAIYERDGQVAYDRYMRETEDVLLNPGVSFPMVSKLLKLNRFSPQGERLVRVVLLSKNSLDAAGRILKSIERHGLDIASTVFSPGGNRFRLAQGLKADLFLCANPRDAKHALDNGMAAATIATRSGVAKLAGAPDDGDQLRIVFDGDSVIFSDVADRVYRTHGLERFVANEVENATVPLGDGPFKNVLSKLHDIQSSIKLGPDEVSPLQIGLVTARSVKCHARVLNTLRSWNISVDELVFADGAPKGPLLKAMGADIFFDDTGHNIESALANDINAGHVPYGLGGVVSEEQKPARRMRPA